MNKSADKYKFVHIYYTSPILQLLYYQKICRFLCQGSEQDHWTPELKGRFAKNTRSQKATQCILNFVRRSCDMHDVESHINQFNPHVNLISSLCHSENESIDLL